ncbi:MAG TPA: Hsp20/alpha crystallin family protein [Isosphaeraceae bacterium]|jgi:HSP20 family protein|nr:Hsp20/alpha crystallin family protein [Isosphaeraceae bacterium]
MSISRFTPQWDSLRDLEREVGNILGHFEPLRNLRFSRPFPSINLYDAGDRFLLTAELPGMEVNQFDLSITGDSLILKGERARSEGVPDDDYRRQERPCGRWSRSITLPGRVAPAQVTAEFSNGVLTVSLPKAEESRPRQIRIQAAAG